jgi:hemerythrin superfamily protein
MNALELLKQDHQTVKELMKQADGSDDAKDRKRLFSEIKKELDTHARIEETIFYPAMKKHDELKDMVTESLKEHKEVKTMLRQMAKMAGGTDKFQEKLTALMESVEHHAEEEEEGKMFPKVRKIVDRGTLEELGEKLESAKHKRGRKAA